MKPTRRNRENMHTMLMWSLMATLPLIPVVVWQEINHREEDN